VFVSGGCNLTEHHAGELSEADKVSTIVCGARVGISRKGSGQVVDSVLESGLLLPVALLVANGIGPSLMDFTFLLGF
jgi:hypothetical protein